MSKSRIVRARLAAAVGLPTTGGPSTSERATPHATARMPQPKVSVGERPHLALRRDIIELHQGPEAAPTFERRIAAGEHVA